MTIRKMILLLLPLLPTVIRPAEGADECVFPGATWEQTTPESQGVDSAKLQAAVDYLREAAGKDGVNRMVIVRNGRVIWRGPEADKPQGVWSVTKAFTSTAHGLLCEGKGRGIIGAINYLASRRVNSIYFLTHNIGGGGKDVWPWTGQPDPTGSPKNDNRHYDIGKLRQWETVFAHTQREGVFLHFVFHEAEEPNKRELDDGELGTERKLYYRELIARFGHHLALEWNLCEEYNLGFDFGPDRVRRFAEYVRAVDPYDHPITVHSAGDPLKALRFTFGDPLFSLTSIQLGQNRIDVLTEQFRNATVQAGRPLPVSMDEFTLDKGQEQGWIPVDDAQRWRVEKLWPTYLSGGNIEFILGDLLETDSFKTPEREKLWTYVLHARRFLEALPFWEMEPADQLVTGAATISVTQNQGRKTYAMGAQVFTKPGESYAIYLPKAQAGAALDLSGFAGRFQQRWYNPRTGEFEGPAVNVTGGAWISLGKPPREAGKDWTVLIGRASASQDRVEK